MGSSYSIIGLSQFVMTGNKLFGSPGFPAALVAETRSLVGERYIVTGANAGLGRATAEALASRMAEIHMVCRNKERGEAALLELRTKTGNSALHLHVADVSVKSDVLAFVQAWKSAGGAPVNGLILNAGILPPKRVLTSDGIESTIATMVMQSYLLSGLMMPYVRRASPSPGRIVHVSSGGQYTTRLDVTNLQFEKNPAAFDGSLQYARVKRAQVILAEMWAQRIPPSEAVSNSMHPGWVDTPGVQASIPSFYESHKETLRTPAQGIDTMVWMASSTEPRAALTTGKFFFDREPVATDFFLAGTAAKPAEKEALWAACERLCGRTFTADDLLSPT